MQIRYRQLIKSNWKIHVFLIVLGSLIISCSISDNTWYFKEGGTLLWVDGRNEDRAIKSAIEQTLEHSSIIVAQISWSPNDTSFYKNTSWYYSLAKDHGKSFMIAIDWQKVNRSGTKGAWSFKDAKIADLFKKDMLRLIETYDPDFINLGVEVNYYALTSSEGFEAFAPLFRTLKKELKQLNPRLIVGLSYQLELLYGHHVSWNESKTLVTLDNLLGDLDFLGISTYPNMVSEKKQSDVLFSTNYLDSISETYALPIGISETAVSSKLYDPDQRETYVKSVFEKANNLDFKFVIWGSIIDVVQDDSWSNKIGLLDKDGFPKKEYDIWRNENANLLR
ncbi:hypothetical protein N8Z19_00025 [Saprospiraceae bacterium]|nr:hypothetical protein [Saprospiraceae bacterium]